MNVLKTDIFDRWLSKLKDRKAKAIIQIHINRLIEGKLGQVKSIGSGVHEKKINYGPGYRLYFVNRGHTLIVLLCGGDKSTQQKDIRQAMHLTEEVAGELKGKI